MTLLNAGMLLGLLLVAVPIVLHMTMRPKPRVYQFPALRLVKPRLQINQRRLNWKQWVLLILRCLLIALLALALARPATASHLMARWLTSLALGLTGLAIAGLATWVWALRRSKRLAAVLALVAFTLVIAGTTVGVQAWRGAPPLWASERAPVAAVLVFDTSPAMAYTAENQTRLKHAAALAGDIIRQLPADSVVAVMDSQTRAAVFSFDLAGAAKSIENLPICYAPRLWHDVVIDALRLLGTAEQDRKEIYLFSDLSRRAWNADAIEAIRAAAAEHAAINWYLIDVGVESPKNVTLAPPRLSAEVIPQDGELVVETTLQAIGLGGDRIVELYIEPPDPQRPFYRNGQIVTPDAVLRGSRTYSIRPGQNVAIQFRLQGLPHGVVHGRLRLSGEDSLTLDDERYFTVHVQDAWTVLLAAPQDVSLRFLAESLAPYELREQGRARFDCVQARAEELERINLSQFAAIVLADPPPLPDSVWKQLAEHVRSGRGLAVFLGHHASDDRFVQPDLENILGYRPTRVVRTGGRDVFFAPHDYQHPALRIFRESATAVPWDRFPVFRHWDVNIVSDQTSVLAYYSNGKPALLEHRLGTGKVLSLTTPLSDVARPPGRLPWNELAFGEDPWPQFVLVNEMMLYLVSAGTVRLNYFSGEPAAVPFQPQSDPNRFQVFPPHGEPYEVRAGDDSLTLRFTELPGNYYLKGNRGGVVQRGFSVNLPEQASDLTRANVADIERILGRGRLRILRQWEQIEREQGQQRVGREFYPLLMVLAAVLFGVESLFANRFYRRVDVQ